MYNEIQYIFTRDKKYLTIRREKVNSFSVEKKEEQFADSRWMAPHASQYDEGGIYSHSLTEHPSGHTSLKMTVCLKVSNIFMAKLHSD